jgi:hypothetical protein
VAERIDIAIIGAGAAGLMSAIFAGRGRGGQTIVAFDGAKKLGAKILIAGGGRCNVTHDVVTERDYAGGSPNAIKKVLRSLTVEQTVDFFRELGVELKREATGKLFPVTDKARTVLEALTGELQRQGVELRIDHRVSGVSRVDDGFTIETSQGVCHARKVILATGGLALPSSGSDGGGYTIARALGHTVTPTWPALVPMVMEPSEAHDQRPWASGAHWMLDLSGVALDAVLTLSEPSGKRIHQQQGAMLFTHFGLSGPAVMDISRHWLQRCRDGKHNAAMLTANLLPGRSFEQLDAELTQIASQSPKLSLAGVLRRWLPERLVHALLEHSVQPLVSGVIGQLKREQRKALCHAMTALPLPVTGDRGFRFAECTAGGVPLDEVQLATMASRLCEGLYLCGELLDCDGRIGGYNFQWAWCTGRLAGIAASRNAEVETRK